MLRRAALPLHVDAALLLATLSACSPHPAADGAAGTTTTVPYDGGAVEWDGWAGEFFTQYCTQCHSPTAYCTQCHSTDDPRTPDFTQKGQVVAHSAMIRCGVSVTQDPLWDCGTIQPEQFPLMTTPQTNPLPSDEDRGRIVAWLDAGCP
jgi:hypothetical protein